VVYILLPIIASLRDNSGRLLKSVKNYNHSKATLFHITIRHIKITQKVDSLYVQKSDQLQTNLDKKPDIL